MDKGDDNMWNDSLKIGVDTIDKQHEMLFTKAGQLFDALIEINKGENHKEIIISTILFLKDYAVTHFADEEAYQISIHDENYPVHKGMHEGFIATVLKHEEKMAASDFADNDVSKFTSTLLAWLINHVSDADQKIGKAIEDAAGADSHADVICECFCNVISNMIDIDKDSIVKVKEHNEAFDNSITIKHSFTHGIKGAVVFDFSVAFIKELMYSLTKTPLDAIGDFEETFLSQIATMIIEDIYRRLSVDEYEVNEVEIIVTEKDDTRPDERISFDTGAGIIDVGLAIA